MKTTIEIADDLIERARIVQKRDDVTLRSLVEEGLRLVLDKSARPLDSFRFEIPVVGEPWRSGMEEVDVNALIADSYQHRQLKHAPGVESGQAAPAIARAPQRRKRGKA